MSDQLQILSSKDVGLRMNACFQCEHRVKRECGKMPGALLEITKLASTVCPESKWPANPEPATTVVAKINGKLKTFKLRSKPREATDAPAPSLARKAFNLAGAVARHVADGLKKVTADEYAARLAVCEPCEFRSEHKCNACGCPLAKKASWRSEDCPKGKWPALEAPAT